MALVAISGQFMFGDGLRFTDTGGGCISYGAAPIGEDAEFRGPDFSMGFTFKKINTTTSGFAVIGPADVNGALRRYRLEAQADSGANLIYVRLEINADAGSANDVVLAQISEDTNEHSVAVTYDFDGDVNLYIDGELVDNAPSPGIDVEGPADPTDVFSVWGSTTPGIEVFYVNNVFFHNTVISASQIQGIHENGLAGDG